MIFGGFMVLLLNSIMLWAQGYDPQFDAWGLLAVDIHWSSLQLCKGLHCVGLCGRGVFVYYQLRVWHDTRWTSTHDAGPRRSGDLGIIITMCPDFLYVGAHEVLRARGVGDVVGFHWQGPIGSVVAIVYRM